MKRILLALGFVVACWLVPSAAQAQQPVVIQCGTGNPTNPWAACTTSGGALAVSGSFSATLAPFAPAGNFATLTATASSADHAIPTGSPAVVALFNTGTTAVSCTFTIGAGVAVANENIIQPSSWLGFAVGTNTHYSCINQAGDAASNVVVASGGTGLPTGAGGGSSGGGGGAITAASGSYASGAFSAGAGADGWDVTLGTKADAAWSSGSGSGIAILKAIAGNTGAAIPAGTALIGKVGIDQTTPGTTNGVQVNAALPAGTNAIGSVTSIGSQYPTGAVAITASATGTTAATTATLAGTSGKTTYICSYSIRANATAAIDVTDTVTGTITGTMSSLLWVAPVASGLGVDEQIFSPCVPASATNTAIAVVSGAPSTGGNVTVHATGYQQ